MRPSCALVALLGLACAARAAFGAPATQSPTAPTRSISYDPEPNLVCYDTADTGPWNTDQRPGDNEWTVGTFGRRGRASADAVEALHRPALHLRGCNCSC